MTTAVTPFVSHFAKSTEAAIALHTHEAEALKSLVALLAEAVTAFGGRVTLLAPGEVIVSDIYGLRVMKVHTVSVVAGVLRLHGADDPHGISPLNPFVRVYTLPELAKYIEARAAVL